MSRIIVVLAFSIAACEHAPALSSQLAAAARASQDDTLVVARRVSLYTGATPLPDGRTFVAALWPDSGPPVVAVTDENQNVIRRLTEPGELGDDAELQAVSPDGSTVSYLIRTRGNECPDYGCRELRVVGSDGTGRRTLLRTQEYRTVYSANFTRDNSILAAQLYLPDGRQRIMLFNISDGSSRVITTFDGWAGPTYVAISPDGRYLAYDRPIEAMRSSRIEVLEIAGGRTMGLAGDDGVKTLVGWASDGSGVFYQVQSSRSFALWFSPVKDGRSAGSARVIRSAIAGTVNFRAVNDAGLAYAVWYDRSTLYSVAIDSSNGRALAAAIQVHADEGSRAVYSADGSHVAFVKYDDRLKEPQLLIRTLATGAEKLIPLAAERASPVLWTPDGQSIEASMSVRGQAGVYRVDLRSGRATFVRPEAETGQQLSPDGRTQYLLRRDVAGGDSARLVARDVTSGAERELYRGRRLLLMGVSPKGDNVALLSDWDGDPARLIVVGTTQGSQPRVLYQTRGRIGNGSVQWHPNSRLLVFKATDDADNVHMLFTVDAVTGAVEGLYTKARTPGERVTQSRFTADGKYVTFWVASGPPPELWMLTNLPGSAARGAEVR